MSRIVLDPTASLPGKAGYTLVTTEVGFWQIALRQENIHIRGKTLCTWAEAFYTARGIPTVLERSPVEAMRDLIPQLSFAQAQQLSARLESNLTESNTFELRSVAAKLFNQSFLLDAPERQHAERYLVWRLEATLDEAEMLVLEALTKEYEHAVSHEDARLYHVTTPEEALDQLKHRLGWEGVRAVNESFSQALPDGTMRKLRVALRKHIVHTPEHFEVLRQQGADKQLLKLAASVSADYFQQKPDTLTQNAFAQLTPYLNQRQRDTLQNLLPVMSPPPVPQDSASLLNWFERDYLPYRTWSRHDEALIAQIGRDFSEVYLRLYAGALSGSPDRDLLTWQRTNRLRAQNSLTLLVVLDGLGVIDAKVFSDELMRLDTQGRFMITETAVAFGPLPSITRCSKPPLEAGVSPDLSDRDPIGPKLTKDVGLTDVLRNAKIGDVVIWSLGEPDTTYHNDKDTATARNKAHHALHSIAERLLEHTRALDEVLPLEIVVTTDHGRLLGSSSRTQSVPEGMKAEGRAATGESSKTFGESGFLVQDDLIFLDRERFRMKEDAAIVLTGDSFLMQDGKRGKDAFPHGGLFPEEVLVPWLKLVRDFEIQELSARLTGSGEAEREAELTLSVTNPNPFSVTLESLHLDFLPSLLNLEVHVDAMSEAVPSVSFKLPSEHVAKAATAELYYRLPDGTGQYVSVEVTIRSHEMYATNNALEDLL